MALITTEHMETLPPCLPETDTIATGGKSGEILTGKNAYSRQAAYEHIGCTSTLQACLCTGTHTDKFKQTPRHYRPTDRPVRPIKGTADIP